MYFQPFFFFKTNKLAVEIMQRPNLFVDWYDKLWIEWTTSVPNIDPYHDVEIFVFFTNFE